MKREGLKTIGEDFYQILTLWLTGYKYTVLRNQPKIK